MTYTFIKAFEYTIAQEGGYSNNPNDKGGKTKFGISKRNHPDVDIENLTLDEAKEIYYNEYWDYGYDMIQTSLAVKIFDLGVNMGVRRAIKLMQATLNKYYNKDLKIDGLFGNKTITAIKEVNSKNLYSLYIFEVSLYYQEISKKDNNKIFFVGWLNRLYKQI